MLRELDLSLPEDGSGTGEVLELSGDYINKYPRATDWKE
jgi:hypothetical protein